jgi:multidrug efflux system membrane fusion protein
MSQRMSRSDRRSSGAFGRSPRQLALAACVAGCLVLSACSQRQHPPEAGQPVIALPVAAVNGSTAAQFPGEVHSRFEMPLSFRVAGQLVSRSARLGDNVRKGQALARLDDSDALKSQASAQAALDAAAHRLTFAAQQRDRDEAQAAQNLISQLQLEQTHDAYASAIAAGAGTIALQHPARR